MIFAPAKPSQDVFRTSSVGEAALLDVTTFRLGGKSVWLWACGVNAPLKSLLYSLYCKLDAIHLRSTHWDETDCISCSRPRHTSVQVHHIPCRLSICFWTRALIRTPKTTMARLFIIALTPETCRAEHRKKHGLIGAATIRTCGVVLYNDRVSMLMKMIPRTGGSPKITRPNICAHCNSWTPGTNGTSAHRWIECSESIL